MWFRVLLLLEITTFVWSVDCPPGWLTYSGNCYRIGKDLVNWTQAEANCAKEGGHLASIHSLEEAKFIVDEGGLSMGKNQNYTAMVWIGGQRAVVHGPLSWTDGTPVDYQNMNDYNPTTSTSLCLMIFSDNYHVPVRNTHTIYKWHDSMCHYDLKYVCKMKPVMKQPLPAAPVIMPPSDTSKDPPVPSLDISAPEAHSESTGNCPPGWLSFSRNCYLIGRDLVNWTQAEANCVKEGGHLASIHSKEEGEFIVDEGKLSTGVNQNYTAMVWIGGQRPVEHGPLSWTDGTPVDYQNMNDYNPTTVDSLCLMIFSDNYHVPVKNSHTIYKWHDSKCHYDLKYVCKRGPQQKLEAPPPAPPLVIAPQDTPLDEENSLVLTAVGACPPGWDAFSDSCYFFGDGVSWPQAEANCQKEGAHLASVHSKAENDFIVKRSVFSTIWLGGKGSKDGKQWEWSDGTQLDYTKLSSGQTAAVDGKCLQASISDWNGSDCSSTAKYVCKKKAKLSAVSSLSSSGQIIGLAPSTTSLGQANDLIKYLMRILCSPCHI